MRRISIVTLTFIVSFVLAGCDKQKANESNLTAGLDHRLARQPLCPGYTEKSFPLTVGANNLTPLKDLSNVGLLTMTQAAPDAGGQPRYTFELTSSGRSSALAPATPDGRDPQIFCFGVLKVDRILNFTVPSDVGGVQELNVTYTTKLAEVPKWASDPAVRKDFPYLLPRMNERPQPRQERLALTNQGWRSPDDF